MLTRNLYFNLGLAGLIIAVAAGDPLGLYGEAVAERATGVLMGLIVILFANAMPKTDPDSTLKAERSPRWRRVRMFAAWGLILGGTGFTAAWIFAPIDLAPFIAVAAMGAGVIATALRFLIGPKKEAG